MRSNPRGQVQVQITPVPPSRFRRLSLRIVNTLPGIGSPVFGSFPGLPWTQLPIFIANLHTNLTPYIFSSLRNPFSVRARDLSSYALAAALR